MKFVVDYSSQIDIPISTILALHQNLLQLRNSIPHCLQVIENGKVVFVFFDRLKFLHEAFDFISSDPGEFASSLFISGINRTNLKVCEEEEEVSDVDLDVKRRIYPHRRVLTIKFPDNEKTQK